MYGPEADRHLLRALVSSVDFLSESRNSGSEQLQLLIKEAAVLVSKPNFVSLLCYAFENQESRVSECVSGSILVVLGVLNLGQYWGS